MGNQAPVHQLVLAPEILSKLKKVQSSSRELRQWTLDQRNKVLSKLVQNLSESCERILEANRMDLNALDRKVPAAFRDRLTLDQTRIQQMCESLEKVISLSDPFDLIGEDRVLSNGIRLQRVRAPLGVILMIFEARPNVITEAFSLALKSRNALIMRGGSESAQTSKVLYELIESALDMPSGAHPPFWGITDTDRKLVQGLMKQNKFIDVLIPRGGDSLIEYVTQNSAIPIIKNDRGLCHVYVHEDADAEMAIEIVKNAKTQRPGVCNSMETLLVHSSQIQLLPKIYDALQPYDVDWFVCPISSKALNGKDRIHPATNESYATEYLDLKINCKVVGDLDEALLHIETFGSKHSEAIVTASSETARKFQLSVDAAVAYWNASTRFTDGYEFGLGGEIGISTQKLHVRGPVGLHELTSLRWIVDGTGQTR